MEIKSIVFKTASNWPFYMSEYLGYFKEEGIDVQLTYTKSSAEQFRGLYEEKYSLGHTLMDNIIAYDEHMGAFEIPKPDFVAFMGGDSGSVSLVAQPGLAHVQDLRGKVIGLDALNTGFAIVLFKILRDNGLSEDEYRLVSVGGTDLRFRAIETKKIDACLLNAPYDVIAEQRGLKTIASLWDYVQEYVGTVGVASRKWILDNAEILEKYLRACVKGTLALLDPAHKQEAIRILAKNLDLDDDLAKICFERLIYPRQDFSKDARIDPRAVEQVIRLRWETQRVLRQMPEASKFYDVTILDSVSRNFRTR